MRFFKPLDFGFVQSFKVECLLLFLHVAPLSVHACEIKYHLLEISLYTIKLAFRQDIRFSWFENLVGGSLRYPKTVRLYAATQIIYKVFKK